MIPLPELEVERIAVLRASHILDSGPSADFDDVVALIRDLLQVPICLVSLVDTDRQWFKARCGLSAESTDRDQAFCGHTILSDDVLVVEDALADPRFADNPLVTGAPHIRFYAGAPLVVRPGVALGSLCVIADAPRRLATWEAVALQRLAKVVTGLIRGHGMAQDAARLARDIAEQSAVVRDQARDLRIRERRFVQTERIARLGGWELDLATDAVTWSDEVYRIYEVPHGTPVDRQAASAPYPPAERTRLNAAIRRTLLDGTGFDEEFHIDLASGAKKWIRATGDVEVHEGVPRRLFGTVHDVTERHRAEAELWRAANCDSLTGLANRNRFDMLLDAAFAGPGAPPGMLMVDADHLKEVNDTLGHDAGDEVIRTVASRLAQAVGPAGTVARVGGDEFAVLLPAPLGTETLDAVADAILDAMRAPVSFRDSSLKPSVSVGGSLGSPEGGPEVLRQSADLALYHAKATRRGGSILFHEDLKSAITARINAVNTVDDALTSGDVLAWYQPVVDLATGRVSGLEALARIRCSDGIHSIGAFADALHDRRTATRLTACMLQRIEADVVAWRAAGLAIPRIAFNVGSLDFQEGAIEALVMATCERTGLEPSRFAMEVTESVFLSRDADIVAEVAARLRARGVIVALDDFGTGHASLAHLGTFPVDIIKMDRSFVMRMDDDGPGTVIATALIDLAHKLNIQVIAEGIEHEAQLDRLIRLGCEKAQGYLFSAALPPSAIGQYLAARQASYPGKSRRRRVAGASRRATGVRGD